MVVYGSSSRSSSHGIVCRDIGMWWCMVVVVVAMGLYVGVPLCWQVTAACVYFWRGYNHPI